MNYLKFAGLSFLAGIVFLICATIFANSSTLGLVLALAITGAGFARIKPACFKVGYALWLVVSAVSLCGTQWLGQMAVRAAAATGNPYAGFAGMEYDFQWFAGLIVSNPICYWLGKRLAKFLPLAEEPPAEGVSGQDMRVRAGTHKVHHMIAATRQTEARKFLASLS